MKIIKIIFTILTTGILFPVLALAEVYITGEEATRKLFPAIQEYKIENYSIDNQEVKVYTVISEQKIIGWAVILNEMGKVKPITFLVGIDNKSKILGVYVLEFRDLFGSEIRRRSFLRQFIGKTIKNSLTVGRDIDAVTGATISSRAASSAVRKSLKLIEEIRKNNPEQE